MGSLSRAIWVKWRGFRISLLVFEGILHIPAQDFHPRDADQQKFGFCLAHTLEDPHLGCRGKNPPESGRTTPPPRLGSQDIGGWAKGFSPVRGVHSGLIYLDGRGSGEVRLEDESLPDSLVVDDTRVWVPSGDSRTQGWEFGPAHSPPSFYPTLLAQTPSGFYRSRPNTGRRAVRD